MEVSKIEKLWNDITSPDMLYREVIEALLPSLRALLTGTEIKHAFGWLDTDPLIKSAHLLCCAMSGILEVVVEFPEQKEQDWTGRLAVRTLRWKDVVAVEKDCWLRREPARSYGVQAYLRSACLRARSGSDNPIPLSPPERKRGVGFCTKEDGTIVDHRDADGFVNAVMEMLGSR